MNALPSGAQPMGGARRPEEPYPPARRDATRIQIVSRPFSLAAFTMAGLALFVTAFACGRYLEQLDAAAAGGNAAVVTPAPVVAPAATPAAPAEAVIANQPKGAK